MTRARAAADPDITARRDELLKQQATIGAELAHIELRLAADIIRSVFGTAAVWLLVDVDSSDGVDAGTGIDVNLLVILDGDQKPLWFNSSGGRHDATGYPYAFDVADDHHVRPATEMDNQTQAALTGHLAAAYNAAGGASGAWFPGGGDEHYGFDFNVLTLSIPAAFDPYKHDDPDEEPKS
jgi:hypothetical protein